MSRVRVVGALLLSMSVAGLMGCPREPVEITDGAGAQTQVLQVDFDQERVFESSVLSFVLRGTERQVAAKVTVTLEGSLDDGQQFSWSYEGQEAEPTQQDLPADQPGALVGGVTRVGGDTGDLVLNIPVKDGLWGVVSASPTRTFTGAITIEIVDFFGDVAARGVLDGRQLVFTNQVEPRIDEVPSGGRVYPAEKLAVTGANFLRPEEGSTIAHIDLGELVYPDGTKRALDGMRVPALWDGSRERAKIFVDPNVFGVREAEFVGDITFINSMSNGREVQGNQQLGLMFSINKPFISTLACQEQDPCPGGSRGQFIDIQGRGLVEGAGEVTMTFLFEGTFDPDKAGAPTVDLIGATAFERAPERYIDDQKVQTSIWYQIERDGGFPFLTGLGATPGVFSGTITPKLRGPGGEQDGEPWQGEFRIFPTRQVVYLKYLPRFSQALDKYGLRNVENEVRAKVIEVAQAPYRDFNVVFVDKPPVDFADFATIELSGPDPYNRNAFGYDNSFNGVAKDTDNNFLADYIGGYNQGSAEEFDNPFGGIYIESFDYFSYEISASENGGSPNADASKDFDRIMRPFMPELGGSAVRGTEWPDGERSDQIREAIDMVGNVVGNTVAHEVGHSMGMAFEATDRIRPGMNFHNKNPEDGALMNSGSSRSFDERANLNGALPAVFNSTNSRYLGEILPGGQ